MRPREPDHQLPHRLDDRAEQRRGQSARRHGAQGIAVQRRILGRGPALLAAEPQTHDPLRPLELGQPLGRGRPRGPRLVGAARGDPGGHLGVRERADAAQSVVQLVGIAGAVAGGGALQFGFDFGDGVGVQQLAQFGVAQQVAQQVPVERERLGASLGQRGVAFVQPGGHVVEDQRAGERAGALRFDLHHPDFAAVDRAQDFLARGQIEDVLEARAVGLEDDRKRRKLLRDRQQALALEALGPQRGALSGGPSGQQQRAGGGLAKHAREQRRRRELLDQQILDLVGVRGPTVDPFVVGLLLELVVHEAETDPVV